MLYINCSCIVNIIIMFTNKHKDKLFLYLQKKIKGRHTPPLAPDLSMVKRYGGSRYVNQRSGGIEFVYITSNVNCTQIKFMIGSVCKNKACRKHLQRVNYIFRVCTVNNVQRVNYIYRVCTVNNKKDVEKSSEKLFDLFLIKYFWQCINSLQKN